jgi:hypothetical protein
LPGASVWQALEASHSAGQYLALARAGPLARWVDGLAETGDLHRSEQLLRTHWRRYVEEVARWQAPGWQAATRWFGLLPELALAPRPAGAPVSDPGAPWLARWLQLMPRAATASGTSVLLQRVAALLMPRLVGDRRGRAALSEPVHRALLRLFRRHGGGPVAVFAHLALVALDVERLRGGLVTRVLFAGRRAGPGA